MAKRQPDKTQPSLVSLFSGIGGFDLGFERAGFRTVLQCEIDEFCQRVLATHWPTVAKHRDIRELHAKNIPQAEVWVAGFPCQDVSLARMGPRAGLKGSQSGLFHEFARLVAECRPGVFVVENVPGLLSSHSGRDFGIVLSTLAKIGYGVGWRVLNSKHFGVPQSRQRVFIVGCLGDPRGPASILFEPERGPGHPAKDGPNGAKPASGAPARTGKVGEEKGPISKDLAYCLYAESARHTGTDWSRNYVAYPKAGEVRRLTPSECEGVMAFPPGWTAIKDKRMTLQEADSARYHALGNAVTPPIAEWLAGRVKQYVQRPLATVVTA